MTGGSLIDFEQNSLILIVDDDFAIRLQLRAALENTGFAVTEAASGEEALTRFAEQRPEMVLLDVLMPGIDGFETCRRLRKLPGGGDLPVVVITGLDDYESIHKAFDAGATDFIAKPINWAILGYRIRYILRSGRILSALKKNQQRLAKAQTIAHLGHWEWNLLGNGNENGRFAFFSETPSTCFGISNPFSFEAQFENIVPEEKARVRQFIEQACKEGRPFSINYRVRLPEGEDRILHNQGEVVQDESPGHPSMVGTVQDITEIKKAEEQIRYLASYDQLTGLANRALFREFWVEAKAHSRTTQTKAAVLCLDLDHFKRINDTLGHAVGDAALKIITARLKNVLRQGESLPHSGLDAPSNLISRLGGDEFAILVFGIKSQDDIPELAYQILQMVERPLLIVNQRIAMTTSLGISVFPDDGDDIDILLKNADTALFEAKEKGRNTFRFFRQAMNEAVKASFELANSLQNALQKGEFVLYYQPQFSARNGRMNSMEALIRWRHPEWGLVPPGRFIPFAEDSGFIHQINLWVLEEACRQGQEWVKKGLLDGVQMGVNISGRNLDLRLLKVSLLGILKKTGLDPRRLELELTENVMMENPQESVTVLNELRADGISIAIDDFGTGYSSLSHLQTFPLSTLKIDRSFILNIDKGRKNVDLLYSIVGIAKSFGLKVVAEGVETEDQLKVVRRSRVDDLQGFLLSPPLSPQEMEQGLMSGKFDTF